MNNGVVLLSGGLDSLVTLQLATVECWNVYALHAGYGQRAAAKERFAFHLMCDYFKVKGRCIIDISYLAGFGSSLTCTTRDDIPQGVIKDEVPSTYVPFRNAHILSAGISWAEALGAKQVYIGLIDGRNSPYPDCKRDFIEAFQNAVFTGTKPKTNIKIMTPFITSKKEDVVKLGKSYKAPFHLSWSCYRQGGQVACGNCEGCLTRLRAFYRAGLVDDINYEPPSDEGRKFIQS